MKLDLSNFDDVRTLIRSRLLSAETHDLSFVSKIPAGDADCDLYRCYYVAVPAPDGFAPWDVTDALLDCWGLSVDDVARIASENEHGTAVVQRMSDVLQEYLSDAPWCDPTPIFVISRHGSTYYGASALFDVQDQLDALFPSGAYVLPSSLFELLFISVEGQDPQALASMVREINSSDVITPADKLSDHVYKYMAGKLTLAA